MKTLINQIGQNGSLFLFAAGNDGENHDNAISDGCPYDLDSPYVVTVGASTQTDKKASFSDYGNKTVHLFAPGPEYFFHNKFRHFLPFRLHRQYAKFTVFVFHLF